MRSVYIHFNLFCDNLLKLLFVLQGILLFQLEMDAFKSSLGLLLDLLCDDLLFIQTFIESGSLGRSVGSDKQSQNEDSAYKLLL